VVADALAKLQRELDAILSLGPGEPPGRRWEQLKGELHRAIVLARNDDDIPAKRFLRDLVVTGVRKAQGNKVMWRELNCLRG
jgi:hypothetical protein